MIKPKKSVEKMKAYCVPLFKEEFKYKLDENENLFGPSPKVVDVLKGITDKNIKFYPAYGKLLEKLSEVNELSSDFFLNTNGADEAICVIFSTYLEENDSVLSVVPSFSMPKIYAQMNCANFVEVPYVTKWQFPLDDFLAKIESDKSIKIVHLTTPNNPTGECISEEALLKIIETSKDKVSVIDETYANYASKFNTELVKKFDNVFVVRSFSKDFALAGLRVGYVISRPENIIQMTKVRSPYSTNSVAMMAAIAALDDKEYFDNVLKQILINKKELEIFFEQQGFKVFKTEANFLLVDFKEKAEFIYQRLLQNSIKVRRFENNDFLKNVFRISIPTQEGVEALKLVFKTMKKNMIVFDMDGVLIDTRNSYRKAIQKTFEFFTNKDVSFEEIQSAKNKGGLNNDWDLTEYLLKKVGVEISRNEIIDKFQELYWNDGKGFIADECLLINKETLDKLSQDYNMANFTGRPRQEAFFAIRANGIERYFTSIVTMDDIPQDRQKPFPDGLEIIKKNSMYNKIFYLGDTSDDMCCANSANVIGVGVLPPQDKSSELCSAMKQAGASFVIDNVNQIFDVLEK